MLLPLPLAGEPRLDADCPLLLVGLIRTGVVWLIGDTGGVPSIAVLRRVAAGEDVGVVSCLLAALTLAQCTAAS